MLGDTTSLRQRSLPWKDGMTLMSPKVGCGIRVVVAVALTVIHPNNTLSREEGCTDG